MKKFIFIFLIVLFLTGCSSIVKKEYYCDNGDTLKGTTCVSKKKTPATPNYTCNSVSYLRGDKCCYTTTGVCMNAPISGYTCYSGYLEGTNCIIETTYNAYER